MKALVLEQYNKLVFEDVPEPTCQEDGVVIQVKACGICGSDVHGMDGSSGRRIPPIIMGHEASGVIVEAGAGVRDFQPGDRVTFDSTIYCGECFFCRRGEINLCDNRRVLGVSCGDYRLHGAFAEYVAVPQRILYRLPEKIGFEQAAMVEPCSIAFHAVRRVRVSLNDTAVVVGAGMIGLFVIQSLRLAGCGRIIAVDVDQNKLDMASQFGADIGLNSAQTDAVEIIRNETAGRGADLAFEVVGTAAPLKTATSSVKKGGSLVLVGNLAAAVEFPLQWVVTREISVFGSCASQGEYPACLDMISRGSLTVDRLISACVPLSEGSEWFARLYNKTPGLMKVILQPGR